MENKPELNLVAIQRDLLAASAEANIIGFEKQISEIPQQADVVVLPEMFTTGFIDDPRNKAEKHLGPTVNWMKRQANKHGFLLCGTLPTQDGDNYYNRFYFVYPDGKVEWYDKRKLFILGNEQQFFTAGSERKIFNYKGWRIMPQVCFDIRFPELARSRGDYDILIYSTSFPAVRDNAWTTLLLARSIENQCYTVGCNRIGMDQYGYSYRGSSLIVSPAGRILSHLRPNTPGLLMAKCSRTQLDAYREKYPFLGLADDFGNN